MTTTATKVFVFDPILTSPSIGGACPVSRLPLPTATPADSPLLSLTAASAAG